MRESLRGFIKQEIVPNIDEWEKNKFCDPALFKKMGENGFFGVSFPEKYGGSGMDFWSAVIVQEELCHANAAGIALSFYAHTFLPLPLIMAIGTEDQKQNYLVPALAGDKIAALGLTEPNSGSDLTGITTTAEDKGDHYLLNGSKTFITNGTIANFVVTLVKIKGKGHSVLLVDTKTAGFSSSKLTNKIGMHSSDTAELFFDNCKIPKENLLGEEGKGFYYIMSNIQEERLLAAVTATEAAAFATQKAKEYALERKAFGQSISEFQVIRHKIANMFTRVEACRSISYRAVDEFMKHGAKAIEIVTMAKAYTCDESNKIISDAIQVHGGWGYIEDYQVARMWRDTRLYSLGAGTTEIMYEILSKLIIDQKEHKKTIEVSR